MILRGMWVAVVCAATVGAATLAAAAPISDVGGTYGKITGGGLTFTLEDGKVTNTSPGSLAAPTLSNVTVDLTGFSANPGPVSLGNITITSGADSLVLSVLTAQLNQVVSAPIGVGAITGTMSVVSNSIADLAAFAAGGNFALTYNGGIVTSNGVNGSILLQPGATASITMSAVPEPSTLALAALGLIGLTVAGRRRK